MASISLPTALIGSAVLGAGTSLLASSNSSDAAKQAAQVQAGAAGQATQLQKDIFAQTQQNLSPYIQLGAGLIPQLGNLLTGGAPAIQVPNPAIAGTNASGQPVDSAGNVVAATVAQPSGAAGGSPFLSAIEGLLPGSGTNALLTSLQGLSPGGSSPLVTGLNSLTPGSPTAGPVVNAPAGFVAGSGVPANPTLTTLSGFVPQGTQDLNAINQAYQQAYKANVGTPDKPGPMTEQQFVNSDIFKGFQDQLNNYYANASNADVAGQIAYQQSRVNDPVYGDSAKALLATLQQRQQAGGPLSQNPVLNSLQNLTPGAINANPSLTAVNALLGLGGPGGAPNAAAIQAALEATPGYQFTLDQGLKSVQNSYAAKGLGSSGAALKGAADYATGLSNQTYEQRLTDYLNNYNSQFTNATNSYGAQAGNALQQFTGQAGTALNVANSQFANAQGAYQTGANVGSILYGQAANVAGNAYGQQGNLLTGLINTGATAGANQGQIGAATGSNIGGTMTGGAAATAGGIVGSSNALTNGLVNTAGTLGNTALTLSLLQQPSGGVSNPSVYLPSSGYGSSNALVPFTPYSGGGAGSSTGIYGNG